MDTNKETLIAQIITGLDEFRVLRSEHDATVLQLNGLMVEIRVRDTVIEIITNTKDSYNQDIQGRVNPEQLYFTPNMDMALTYIQGLVDCHNLFSALTII